MRIDTQEVLGDSFILKHDAPSTVSRESAFWKTIGFEVLTCHQYLAVVNDQVLCMVKPVGRMNSICRCHQQYRDICFAQFFNRPFLFITDSSDRSPLEENSNRNTPPACINQTLGHDRTGKFVDISQNLLPGRSDCFFVYSEGTVGCSKCNTIHRDEVLTCETGLAKQEDPLVPEIIIGVMHLALACRQVPRPGDFLNKISPFIQLELVAGISQLERTAADYIRHTGRIIIPFIIRITPMGHLIRAAVAGDRDLSFYHGTIRKPESAFSI